MIQVTKCFNKNILLLIFLIEILSKSLHYFGYDFIRISLLVKGIILAVFINSIPKKNWIFFAALFLVFLVSFSTIDGSFFFNDVLERIFSFFKYIFFPITFFYFKELLADKDFYVFLKKQFAIIFLINFSLILIAYLWEIDFFRTYTGERFGYNGIFVSENESSYILLSGFFFFFWFGKNNINLSNVFKISFSIVALSLVGTKTIYFSLLLFFMVYFLHKRNVVASTLTVFTTLLILLVTLKNSVISSSYQLYLEKGFWYSFTSFRSDYIQTRFIHQIENCWTLLHYFFGGPFTVCYKLIEMEFFDLFVFFGFIGSIIYSLTIFKACSGFFHGRFTHLIAFIFLGASFFSGHLFLSGSVSIYVVSLMFLIKKNGI